MPLIRTLTNCFFSSVPDQEDVPLLSHDLSFFKNLIIDDEIENQVRPILEQMMQLKFLPNRSTEVHGASTHYDYHYLRLLFLACKIDDCININEREAPLHFIPVTEEAYHTIILAKRWRQITTCGLNPLVAGGVFSCCAVLPVLGLLSLTTIPTQAVIAVTYSSNVLAGCGLSYAGLVLTGTFPDRSSNTANSRQDQLALLSDDYKQMALKLLELFCSEEQRKQNLAIQLADKIKVPLLKTSMLLFLNDLEVERLLTTLAQVVAYINLKESFKDAELRAFCILMSQKRLAAMEPI